MRACVASRVARAALSRASRRGAPCTCTPTPTGPRFFQIKSGRGTRPEARGNFLEQTGEVRIDSNDSNDSNPMSALHWQQVPVLALSFLDGCKVTSHHPIPIPIPIPIPHRHLLPARGRGAGSSQNLRHPGAILVDSSPSHGACSSTGSRTRSISPCLGLCV